MGKPQQVETAQVLAQAYQELHANLHRWLRYKVGDETVAEDLLQEVFSKALAASHQNGLPANPAAWLRTIARNTLVDFYRVKQPLVELPDDLPEAMDEGDSAAFQLSQCLLPLAKQLPDIYRDTLLAADFDGRTLQSLADEWGVSLSAVKSRVSRGRRLLRERLLDCCAVELSRSGQVMDFHQKQAAQMQLCPGSVK
ncbi:sigma-70 family RNA polymerase sigma factor [Thiothrix winogradskyi]|uniref:Sigma-70 family RNA polymerase sigma factor n=1 Tax=Thiothrix winogradskyi TaxID=96472 RepID=A0ABY3T383_9GAMM|nr:sigma-70 family RNA polymerase sigma factor [Thiothrix winogradskyi]UJS26316.1 sigma-70 family RNA polymerase sigma factor [Thiothrix winogradskyi]